jgi:hypothetical protein
MTVRITHSIRTLLLGISLVLVGTGAVLPVGLPPVVTAVLALVAGVLILVGR